MSTLNGACRSRGPAVWFVDSQNFLHDIEKPDWNDLANLIWRVQGACRYHSANEDFRVYIPANWQIPDLPFTFIQVDCRTPQAIDRAIMRDILTMSEGEDGSKSLILLSGDEDYLDTLRIARDRWNDVLVVSEPRNMSGRYVWDAGMRLYVLYPRDVQHRNHSAQPVA